MQYYKLVKAEYGAFSNQKKKSETLFKLDGSLTSSIEEVQTRKTEHATKLLNVESIVDDAEIENFLFSQQQFRYYLNDKFSMWEYVDAVKEMKQHKSTGKDGI